MNRAEGSGLAGRFWSAVEMAQEVVGARLGAGEVAVDATAGNGRDTEFLAGCVGEEGRVYAFDVQEGALEATRRRLEEKGWGARVRLVGGDHAEMALRLESGDVGKVGAVMFNLGFLPGGDKALVTRPETTLAAVRVALEEIVRAGGVVTVVVYTGHAGGDAEGEALESWISGGLPEGVECVRYGALGRRDAPYVLAFRRNGGR